MEQSNSLLLNEEALRQCPDPTKSVFVYEWLRYLDRILSATKKNDMKNYQEKLLEQLTSRISLGLGSPSKILLARCISKVFAISDKYNLFDTINICNDLLKVKEDSGVQLQAKLTALCVLGTMYEKLGRLVVCYEETFQILLKWIKIADSCSRIEILNTLAKMISGLGSTAYSIHKDLYKLISKNYLFDRVMLVRIAALKCLSNMVVEQFSPIYLNEIDTICTLLVKALNSSDFHVRTEVANVFGNLVVHVNNNYDIQTTASNTKNVFNEKNKDIFVFMAQTFLRGNSGGFLKTGKNSFNVIYNVRKEIRIGITLAYVKAAHFLGIKWLENNLYFWIQHLLEIVSKFGSLAYTNDSTQATEIILMRRCILYIFRNSIGVLLSEQYQITACKHLGEFLTEYNNFDSVNESSEDKILNADSFSCSETLIVILLELSALVCQIGSSIRPLFIEANGIMEPVFGSLIHPVYATRVSAAWCLRCITFIISSQCTPLIDRCLNRLEYMKKQPEVINGFSLALAALLASSKEFELGIPYCKVRHIFEIAEEMIKTATQSPKLAQKKINSGWLLMSAVISKGESFVQKYVNRITMLWKYSFPRSINEAKAEKERGDLSTWECTLESRSGALASIDMYLQYCSKLVTKDLINKIILIIETCLTTITFNDILLSYSVKLRNSINIFRIRLYNLLIKHLQLFECFDSFLSLLLRELITDITIADKTQLINTNSLASGMCLTVESSLLGGWIKNTTESYIELWAHKYQTVKFGALEYDAYYLIDTNKISLNERNFLWPEPLQINVTLINCAIRLFSKIFPILHSKHKFQVINHFYNGLKQLKSGPNFQAIELNVLTALCSGIKAIGETTRSIKINDDDELQRVLLNLILPNINSDQVLLKCLTIETFGRIVQAVAEPQFVAGNAQYCFDKLRSIRDEKSRTGYALSLGCLHRYMGSLGSGQHLNTSVSIILALAQDASSSTVQCWSILSLSLIASTGGGMFRGYVEPSLSLCLRLLLSTPSTNVDVIHSVSKLISALITAVGPELLSNIGTIEHTRSSFLIACSMMYEYSNPQIKVEALYCFQQLHLFAPRFVQLDLIVTYICELIYSPYLNLRKAAICCLRQFLQKEAKEVREHAQALISLSMLDKTNNLNNKTNLPINGIEGALIELLNIETDKEICQFIKECILFLLHATCSNLLNFWLTMCKDILSLSYDSEFVSSINYLDENKQSINGFKSNANHITPLDDLNEQNLSDVDDIIQICKPNQINTRKKIMSRWSTRVFGFEILRKLMAACDTERAHLDLALAKELQMSNGNCGADYLVLHLSDLVRMAFIGATSDNDKLRLSGLYCLQDIIIRFASVPEPEFPGHLLLEQFQAQVGAALRPAFEPETLSSITAVACEVCSTWICSGVARDLNDLRRVHQLLVSSLSKLRHGSINTQLYNESAATLEKLSILKAWAEVYIVAIEQKNKAIKEFNENDAIKNKVESENYQESLLNLVNPELNVLIGYWLAALRDSALLFLPPEYKNQLPENGGAFYTNDSLDSCREYYRNCWLAILLATSIWLKLNNDFDAVKTEVSYCLNKWPNDNRESRFYLLIGMCIEYLCNNRQYNDFTDRTIQMCLSTLVNLLDCEWSQLELMKDVRQAIEIINVLHRLLLSRDNLHTQKLCVEVIVQILNAAEIAIQNYKVCDENTNENLITYKYKGMEGPKFNSKTSLVFAVLEVSLCLLVRQIPQINFALVKNKSNSPLNFRKYSRLSAESFELINQAFQLLTKIPKFCSREGAVIIVPSILYLILIVLKESSIIDSFYSIKNENVSNVSSDIIFGQINSAATAAIFALKSICSITFTDFEIENDKTFIAWESLLRSALLSLLNMNDGEIKVDKTTIMLASTVMITSGPLTLIYEKTLFSRLCNLYKTCLDSNEPIEVQIKTLQSITSLFTRNKIRELFIQELGSTVFSKIRLYIIHEQNDENEKTIDEVIKNKNLKSEFELPILKEISNKELLLIQETFKTMETILRYSTGEKERLFINLLVRSFCRFLCPNPAENLHNCHPNVRSLHDFSLKHINLIGLNYPIILKAIINVCPDVRQRIEDAAQYLKEETKLNLKNQVQPSSSSSLSSNFNDKNNQQKIVRPSIKLNIDFSTFK